MGDSRVGLVRARALTALVVMLPALVPLQATPVEASTGPLGSIAGTVFDDLDASGGQDAGEDGIADVSVSVTGAGLDGTFDTGDDTTASTTTGSDGSYTVGDLTAGQYRVEVDETTLPRSAALTTAGNPLTVTVGLDEDVTGVDFGYQPYASISGLVFDDTDADGTHDAGEDGLAGVDVTLTGAGPDGTLGTADDTALGTATTPTHGTFTFPDLPPGDVRVDLDHATLPQDHVVTTANDPTDLTLSAGEARGDVAFGSAEATSSLTLTIGTGLVETFAGNGTSATVDGVGTTASFGNMATTNSAVWAQGALYVATQGAIRRVDPDTAEVTTLAGHPTATGCVDSTNAASVRFETFRSITTDGYYLYTSGSCGTIRRTSIATGATSTVGSWWRNISVAYAPDGYLYGADESTSVLRIDPLTGAVSTFATMGSGSSGRSIAADGDALWVVAWGQVRKIFRIDLEDRTVTTVRSGASDIGLNALTVAGDWLYGVTDGDNGTMIQRTNKVTGAWTAVAGTRAGGYADGTGTDAWFTRIEGLASDGTRLWVAENDRRIRTVVDTDPLPAGVTVQSGPRIGTGLVETFAGSGTSATVDGVGTSASFGNMATTNSAVWAAGALYVATEGAIRRVDPDTAEVTTLAGHPTATGCVDSTNAPSVRFGSFRSITTDGYYLYTSGSCGIRRTSLATGATSTVATPGLSVAYAPDGYLYGVHESTTVSRIDPLTGAVSTFGHLPAGWSGRAITSDAEALWVTAWGGSKTRSIFRVDLQSKAVTTLAQSGATGIGLNMVASVGRYLYATVNGDATHAIDRYDKQTGAKVRVAGTLTAGYADGAGTSALFYNVSGLASDGTSLWIGDRSNRRIRYISTDQMFVPAAEALGLDGYGWWAGGVNAPLANLVVQDTDASVASVGPELAVQRTYNSRDERTGWFGRGWTSPWEMTFVQNADGRVSVLWPDGRREVHTPDGLGGYRPPTGYFSTLDADGVGGFLLTVKDGSRYFLDSSGQLESVLDANGRMLNPDYDASGQLASVTDIESGRALDVTWADGKVASVSTDAVAAHGGPLTWTYGYAGDLLTQVCDPHGTVSTGAGCTRYEYSGGRLTRVVRPEGNDELAAGYDDAGRVVWRDNGVGDRTSYSYGSSGTVTTTDPRGNATIVSYDERFRVTSTTDAAGGVTSYVYDADGNRQRIVDPTGVVSTMSYDTRGNLTSTTCVACGIAADGSRVDETSWFTYDAEDNLVTSRDPRSASASDATYVTAYDYDDAGNRTAETSPPTAAFPTGVTRTWVYTDGTEAAVGGGTVPEGLVEQERDAKGNATTYRYTAAGDLAETVDRAGQTTTYVYDELGRRTSQTVLSDTFPGGVTTDYVYDELSRLVQQTGPPVTNPITGEVHRQRTVHVYDANGNATSTVVADLWGDGTVRSSRTSSFVFDDADRQTSATDPEGGATSRTYDAAGNVATVTDAQGRVVRTDYDSRNLPTAVVLTNFVDPNVVGPAAPLTLATYEHDAAGRRVVEVDAEERRRELAYDGADRVVAVTLTNHTDWTGTTSSVVLVANRYDRAGNLVEVAEGEGARVTSHVYDAMGRRTSTTLDPGGLDRVTTYVYDDNGNVTSTSTSQDGRTETVTAVFDVADRVTSRTVHNGTEDLTSWFSYDQRGLRVSSTDPRGSGPGDAAFTSNFSFDQAGQLTQTLAPPVSVESGGLPASTVRPTTMLGYDGFGNVTDARDANGNVTVTLYDRLDRKTTITHPSYSPPGGGAAIVPEEQFGYDAVGNLVSRTSRRGQVTEFVFDSLNRVVRETGPADDAGNRPVTTSRYDAVGNLVGQVDPTDVVTETGYDSLDRPVTSSQVRLDGSGNEVQRHTWVTGHDLLGRVVHQADPTGAVTTHTYDAADQRTSTTDAADQLWSYGNDLAARPTSQVDPLGRVRANLYDLAGRLTQTAVFTDAAAQAASQPESVTRHGYDPAGNRIWTASPRGVAGGWRTDSTFDAAGRLTSVAVPVDATSQVVTGYGYDAAGNHTRTTDGNGQTWVTTYQSWNLPETSIEPATTAHPTAAERTFTTVYDAGGLPVRGLQPGGVSVTRDFDALGRLTAETGSDATTRSFGYDLAGRRTQLGHPDGTVTFAYDWRGLPAQVEGPAGDTDYGYDAAGRLTSRTDPAGTHTFSWTDRGELATATDPLTGATRTYTWDVAGRLDQVGLSGGAVRDLSFDTLDRLVDDRLTGPLGTSHRLGYGYDDDGNLTSQTITASGNSGAGTHSYGYDRAGRLTAWTAPGGSLTGYSWDDNGNRLTAGSSSYSYDQRNRITSGPSTTYSHSARGTLDQTVVTTPGGPFGIGGSTQTTTHTFDALGRQTQVAGPDGTVELTYDSLDRIATRGTTSFTYSGAWLDPTSDGTAVYARSPSGRLLAVDPTGPAGPSVAGLNRHGDLAHLHSTAGTLTASKVYDPFGQVAGTSGSGLPAAGFQGDYTDPTSNEVWQGSRWYQPTTGVFTSRDTYAGELATPISLNRFTYAGNNPLRYFDPDGRAYCETDDCGKAGATVTRGDNGSDVIRRTNSRGDAVATTRATDTRATGAARGWSEAKTAAIAGAETIQIQVDRGQHPSTNQPGTGEDCGVQILKRGHCLTRAGALQLSRYSETTIGLLCDLATTAPGSVSSDMYSACAVKTQNQGAGPLGELAAWATDLLAGTRDSLGLIAPYSTVGATAGVNAGLQGADSAAARDSYGDLAITATVGAALGGLGRLLHGPVRTAVTSRQHYVDAVRRIPDEAHALLRDGATLEQAARFAVATRNALKEQAREGLAGPLRWVLERRNLRRYGDPIGPSADNLLSRFSPSEIIDKASRTDPFIDRLLRVK